MTRYHKIMLENGQPAQAVADSWNKTKNKTS